MWTETTRRRHARKGLRYSSDLTDEEWAVLEPLLPRRSRVGRPPKWPLRTIIDAMLYILRSGQPWRMPPRDFPAMTTVQRDFYTWRVMDCREAVGRSGSEEETVRCEISGGFVKPDCEVFHLSTPPKLWWDNVVFACSTFQPFRQEADVARWCRHHDLPRGGVVTIPKLWRFAQDWYGSFVDQPWRKRSADEVRTIFERNGLTGPFWII